MLSLSLPASQPEPKLTSRLHFQRVPPFITRQGCGEGFRLGGGVRQGASNGAECAPHPSFSSPQAAENTGLCHRQQPHSSLTTSTMELQIYSGEARPAPFSCSLAPSPLSLAPPIQLFSPLLVTLFPWLFSLTLNPSALVPLLSPLGHHSSYFVPLVLAQCLGCPDSKEEVAAYPSGCLGLANGKKKRSRGPHS